MEDENSDIYGLIEPLVKIQQHKFLSEFVALCHFKFFSFATIFNLYKMLVPFACRILNKNPENKYFLCCYACIFGIRKVMTEQLLTH